MSHTMHVGRCGRCGAAVFWGRTQRGKFVPLNPMTQPGAVVLTGDEVSVVPVYVLHQTTCAQAQGSVRASQRGSASRRRNVVSLEPSVVGGTVR